MRMTTVGITPLAMIAEASGVRRSVEISQVCRPEATVFLAPQGDNAGWWRGEAVCHNCIISHIEPMKRNGEE
jgi:hypothetical protein